MLKISVRVVGVIHSILPYSEKMVVIFASKSCTYSTKIRGGDFNENIKENSRIHYGGRRHLRNVRKYLSVWITEIIIPRYSGNEDVKFRKTPTIIMTVGVFS